MNRGRALVPLLLLLLLMIAACGGGLSAPRRATLDPHPRPYAAPSVAPPAAVATALVPQRAVAADVSLLLRTLDDVYPGRRVLSDWTWSRFRERLAELAAEDRDAGAICTGLAEALELFGNPQLATSLDGRYRCDPYADAAGSRPTAGPPAHAAPDAPTWSLRREDGPVVVLAIHDFARVDTHASGWLGFDRAVDEAVHAPAVIVDLRGAHGDDPGAALPLLTALTGAATMHPVTAIVPSGGPVADALRTTQASERGAIPPLPATWQALRGGERAPASSPERFVSVLVDDACEEACQLVARVLAAYAHADVHGRVGTTRRRMFVEPGMLVLPSSHVRVQFPTAVVELAPIVAFHAERGREWLDADGSGHVDLLPDALADAQRYTEERARLARLAAAPPAGCATLAPVASPELLAPALRARLHGDWDRDREMIISARIDLPADAAQAWIDACPGITRRSRAAGQGPTGVELTTASFEALSRLLRSDAVAYVEIRIEEEEQPNVASR